MCGDVGSELLVYFLDYLRAPALDLIVHQVDLLVELIGLVLLFGQVVDFPLERDDFGILLLGARFAVLGGFFIAHLKLMEHSTMDFMVLPQLFDFPLVLRDSHQKLRVGLLASQESVDDLIDIG